WPAIATGGSPFVFGAGSLTWFRRPRLASPTLTTEVETNHPHVWDSTDHCDQIYYSRGSGIRRLTPAHPLGLFAVPAAPLLGCPRRLPLGISGHDDVALVVEPASLGQGDLDLCPPIAKVQRGGNERQGL